MEAIHNSRIIHGDICEQNILYSQGKVYFIDFGYSDYNHRDERVAGQLIQREGIVNTENYVVFNQGIPKKYESLMNKQIKATLQLWNP